VRDEIQKFYFWSDSRVHPNPLIFNPKNPEHVEFALLSAKFLAAVLGLGTRSRSRAGWMKARDKEQEDERADGVRKER
jgi:hypothetical protein